MPALPRRTTVLPSGSASAPPRWSTLPAPAAVASFSLIGSPACVGPEPARVRVAERRLGVRWKREDSQQRCRTKRPQLDIPTREPAERDGSAVGRVHRHCAHGGRCRLADRHGDIAAWVGMLVATANIEVTLTVNASGKLMVSVPLGPVE